MKESRLKYVNLKAEMARCGVSGAKIAKVIGRTDAALYGKINGQYDWRLAEMMEIQKYLCSINPERAEYLTLEYLFGADARK